MLTVVGTVAFDTLALVKALPGLEQTGGIERIDLDAPGGTAGNVVMALAALGMPCRLAGSIGPEFAASAYAKSLARAGVDTRGLHVADLPTARAYVFHDEAGQQTTYFYPGASAALDPTRIDVAGGRVHFCAGEIARYPALMEAAAWVSFDPGQELFHRSFDEIEACLPHADIVFANRHELALLESHGWDARRFLAEGAQALVETRSAEGTLVHTPTGRFAAPGIPVVAFDPTGAGDAHRAGFLFALEQGLDVGAAARVANVMGSFAVEHASAQRGHPSLARLVERHEKAYGSRPF